MKALSLTQPYATLVAIGAKCWETRSWKTDFRGQLAIHAAKTFPREARALCQTEPFKRVLMVAGYRAITELPLGAILATCTLTDCVPTERIVASLSAQERAFGDFTAGRWAWQLEDVQLLPEPIEAKGALSLWTWTRKETGQ